MCLEVASDVIDIEITTYWCLKKSVKTNLFFVEASEGDSKSFPHRFIAVAVDEGVEGAVGEDEVELDVVDHRLQVIVPVNCL